MNTKSIKMNKDFLIMSGFGTLFVCENIINEDKTITLSPGYNSDLNISFKVLFKNGHVKTTNEHMTLNGLPVVVNRYGTLIPIPNHKIVETENYYYTLQANTILEMYYTDNYDGNNNPAFVVVGNPVVLSSTDYTIYADGKIGNDLVGTVKAWSLAKVPYGWHDCDHSAISRTIHSELFDLFRTQTYDGTSSHTLLSRYGTGDGTTTFNLPDYRECALVGVGSNGTFITQTTQNHEIHTLGQFIDDKIQNITGKFTVLCSQYVGTGDFQDGAFSKDDTYPNQCGSGANYMAKLVSFNASRVVRTGNVTHGKQIGVKYIIKVL